MTPATWLEFFTDHTLLVILSGTAILGVTSGSLGAFALLRRQSLLGDAISHATLPGVAVAFMMTQSKHPLVLLSGAAAAGWTGTLFVKIITEQTRVKTDAALGVVLSVFFGFGLVLLTIIQKMPLASKAGLDKFLFGNAATLLRSDVTIMSTLGLGVIACLILFWKEFKIISFDPDYARSQGLPVHGLDIFLTALIVTAIVSGLQTVGVILMSAMIVAPAAAARQWTDRLGMMVLISAVLGAAAGSAGAVASGLISRLPTGPAIVVFLSALVFGSLLFAPRRGLLWDWYRAYKNRSGILRTTMLKNLLLFSEIGADPFHPHHISALQSIGRASVHRTLTGLKEAGLVEEPSKNCWALTPLGLKAARKLNREYERLSDADASA
jgi:manganese/zinc/iron transport system permease protein